MVPADDVGELPANGLGIAGAPDPGTPRDDVAGVEPGEPDDPAAIVGLIVEGFPAPDEELPVPIDDVPELVDDGRGDTGATGVSSREIPLLPSTDPVWTLEIGLHGIDVVLVGPGVGLGGAGTGLVGT